MKLAAYSLKKILQGKQTLLIIILFLAAMLRFWNLGSVPPSASMDEASIGYNAYSVLKIGVDEFGEFPFISQRGYDDWRRSTYLFLTIPFIALLDLQVIAVRLPAVLLSILTVWATYHITLLLFSKRTENAKDIAFLASLFLAISPWHMYISRLGHESNACLAFLVFGILFFLQGLTETKKLFLSMIFFTLSMISYYTGQVFVPVFGFGLLLIFRKNLLAKVTGNKKMLIPLSVYAFLLIIIFWVLFSPASLTRFQGTSTFKKEAHQELFRHRVELRNKAVENNDIIGTILYNRRLFPVQVFFEGYISHFNLKWLFTNISSDPHKVPNMGLLYLWELPFILIGMITLSLRSDIEKKTKMLLILWFFLGPLPASIATQTPHAMRSYNFLPTWQIFTALGLMFAITKLKRLKVLALLALAVVIVISLGALYKNYFIIFPREQSRSFQYALAQTIPYVISKEHAYEKVVFSNKDNLYQSYMLFLYFSRYDPLLYQKQGGTKSGGYEETHAFGKYEFRPITWDTEEKQKTLFIGNPGEIPEKNSLFQGRYLNGSVGTVVQEKKYKS